MIHSSVSIVGIVNTTPDSYYDGGLYNNYDDALRRVEILLQEGADWIEIGGESTGPHSKDVSLNEEIDRTIPLLQKLKVAYPEAQFSFDTWKAEVARLAIESGVEMINDVTAGRGDQDMFPVIARHPSVKYVLMYAKDASPRTTIQQVTYDDVVSTIKKFIQDRSTSAQTAGVQMNQIVIDPGLGHFLSSHPQYSYEVLKHLHQFTDIAPVFISPSRKSFLSGLEHLPAEDRLSATIAASAIAVEHGAKYIRTHDVLHVRRGCEVGLALRMHSEEY